MFQIHPWICFSVFPKVFTKPSKLLRKSKMPEKTKENKKHQETSRNKFLKVLDSPLDVVFFMFSRRFLQNHVFRKSKIQKKTKENKNALGKTKTKFLKVSGAHLDMFFFFFLFWCFGFPEGFYKTFLEKIKNIRKPTHIRKQTKTNSYPRVSLTPLKLCFLAFLKFFWFYLVLSYNSCFIE